MSSPLLDSLKLVNGNTEYHFVLYMYVYMYPTKKNCMYVCTYVCIFGVQMNPTATSKFIFLHLRKKKYGFDFRKYFSSNVKTIIIEKRSNFQFY